MLKRLAAIALGLTALISAAAPVSAAKLQFFATGDYYLRSGIEDDIEDDNSAAVAAAGTAEGEVTTTNGIGGRVGLRVPMADDRFDLGASFSYIKGPEIDSELNTPIGNVNQNTDTFFSRVMAEAGLRLPISERVHFRLGAGAGIGRTRVENKVAGSGIFFGSDSSGTEEQDGFTWEVSPAFVFTGGVDFELGLRYAQFEQVDETDETPEINWKPLGFYLGLAF